jgi:hypothetical protein
MRLPLKFLPRMSQLIAEAIGALVMLGIGIAFFSDYASPGDFQHSGGFVAWLRANPLAFVFMLASIGLLLAGLGWFTVAVINLVSGSPFNYLIIDRFGITYRNFWRENRYSWKDLGPVQALNLGIWQGRSSQRRHWIIADTLGTESGGGRGPFWSNPEGTLRIPAAVYLGGGMLIGTLDLATNDAAGWLEELRQLARADRFETEGVPRPPDCFRTPIEIDIAAPDAHAVPRERPDRGAGPTVER